ncbi:MAG: ABC transporter permease, partial [Planctomycetota bacterium]|nr:ABC transporter permease [Planctomycetota bacterium]
GKATAVIDIPSRFEQSLLQGEQVSVQMQVDATNTLQGPLAAGYAEQIVGQYAVEIAIRNAETPVSLPQIEDDHRLWFNPNIDDRWYAPITELLSAITIFCVLLPAATMAREKERGTIEQLTVSPLTPTQIMAPKVIAMTIAILAGTILSWALIIMPCFGIPMRGSLTLLLAVTVLYIVTMTGLGLVAGTIARNMGQVGMMAMLILLPTIILSNIFTPPEGKPAWVLALSELVPLRHYFDITIGILLKGAGLDVLWSKILLLGGLGAGVLAIGRWCFHRQFK